ncbi:MAG: helix-turn-helix domain-containing protein [Chloroflexota bacterium]
MRARLPRMVVKQRAVHRGTSKGREAVRLIGKEIRLARTQLGLSAASVARACGISTSELTRIERGEAHWVAVITLARVCAVVGLDLAVRAYPGGPPIRDHRHAQLIELLHAALHVSLGWALEVPLPNPGDQRAWDAMIRGSGWRYGVECEMNPIDGQALLRRLALKTRDGGVDGVIILLPDTRQARLFKREFRAALDEAFPVRGATALGRLGAGLNPGGSAIISLATLQAAKPR